MKPNPRNRGKITAIERGKFAELTDPCYLTCFEAQIKKIQAAMVMGESDD